MKTEEILKGNTLIANFLGYEIDSIAEELGETPRYYVSDRLECVADGVDWWDTYDGDWTSWLTADQMKFHSSWDWLMPVVEKIETLIFGEDEYFNFQILGGCSVYIISSHGRELVSIDNEQSKLECAYKAAIEFLKWYNKNKQL